MCARWQVSRLCCIGPRTAEALSAYGLHADVIPSNFRRKGFSSALDGRPVRGMPRLDPARVGRAGNPSGTIADARRNGGCRSSLSNDTSRGRDGAPDRTTSDSRHRHHLLHQFVDGTELRGLVFVAGGDVAASGRYHRLPVSGPLQRRPLVRSGSRCM